MFDSGRQGRAWARMTPGFACRFSLRTSGLPTCSGQGNLTLHSKLYGLCRPDSRTFARAAIARSTSSLERFKSTLQPGEPRRS